ncbi:MAG: terminase small subunit [Burkholderiales bacterium]|nr:terminase small subunit [Burkholderiales bacterium]
MSFLVTREIINADGTGAEWLLAYCDHLRKIAAGRYTDGDLDLATERAHLARAQRERIEMQNAVTRKELAPVTMLEEVLSKAGGRAVRILEAVPAKLKRGCHGFTSQMSAMVRDEIARACNAISGLSLATLDDPEEDQDSDA